MSMQDILQNVRDRSERMDRSELVEYVMDIHECPGRDLAESVVDKALDKQSDFDAPYDLSENQEQFVRDARNAGLEIDFTYSGRGMYGKECPSVVVDDYGKFSTSAETQSDQMGLSVVIYAPN